MRTPRYALPLLGVLALAGCREAPPPPESGPVPPPASPPARFDPWQNARERGIEFRAAGQEPGWYVEVDHEKGMRLVFDYGEQQIVTAEPLQAVDEQGTTLYRTPEVEIAIEQTPCADAMSGQRFPNTVTVNAGGRALRGCGQPLH